MTERLYYTDSSLMKFDAQVLQVVTVADGRPAAILDRTAFYPASGGQPFDTGTLGSAAVVDVRDLDDGTILHVFEGSLEPGPVRGRIDRARRLDHTQQHTGQHVLSAAFDRVVNAATVSFHMGAERSTIDLASEVSPSGIELAEEEANRVVWADVPVTIRFVDATEAARLQLRKETSRTGLVRLVDIADVDLSACGGTHVISTGAIGLIVVTGWERVRGGSRVEFACGHRALRSHRALRTIVAESGRVASVAASDVPGAIERLQAEARDRKRELKELRSEVAIHQAATLASTAELIGAVRFVLASIDGADAGTLKQIATAIVTRPGHGALLLSSPSPSSIVMARASDLSIDASALLKRMVDRFGGKGGGRPDLAQGGGLEGQMPEMLAHARASICAQVSVPGH